MVLGFTDTVQFELEVEGGRICKSAHPSLNWEPVLSIVIEWGCREGSMRCIYLLKWISTRSISLHAKPVAFRRRVTRCNLLLQNPCRTGFVPLNCATLWIFVRTGDDIVVNEAIGVAVGKISERDFQIRSKWLAIVSLNDVSNSTGHCHWGYRTVDDFNVVIDMLVWHCSFARDDYVKLEFDRRSGIITDRPVVQVGECQCATILADCDLTTSPGVILWSRSNRSLSKPI